jgi:signal transduction histidine kinase
VNDTEGRARLRERWLEASRQVTAAVLSGENFPATLHLIAEEARSVSGANVGAIARPSEDDEAGEGGEIGEITVSTLVFEVIASPDPEHDQLANTTVPVEGTATGSAFSSGRPVVVRQYGGYVAEQQGGSIPETVKDLDAAVAVPLIVGAKKLGVLVVAKFGEQEPFTEDDVEMVREFAVQAAVTMEFARAESDRRRLAVFEDRERIARDLHDLVIQRLFTIGLGLRELDRPELGGFVADVDATIREIRNSIFSLQETADGGGFRSELLRTARESSAALGFEPRVGFDGPLEAAITGQLRADVLATVRESLANVARHAGATAVSVEAVVDPGGRRLTLTVTDDGVGVGVGTPGKPLRRSGLANLSRRAHRWSGTCTLDSGPDGGTRLTWTAQAR